MNMSISTSQMPVASSAAPSYSSAQSSAASKAPAGLLTAQGAPVPPPSSSPATVKVTNEVGQMSAKQLVAERTESDKLSAAQTQTALQEVNKVMDALSISVRFQVDPEDQQMVIKVVDQDSGKVIRQFPSEEVVRISKALDNLKGLLFAQTA
jgi:flagellar protein FlaG